MRTSSAFRTVVSQRRRWHPSQRLHVQVYGLDESPAEDEPYLVTETQVEVHVLHRGAGDRASVFGVLPRETRSFHTEREGSDARVVRELSLEITPEDARYGHVSRTAELAFGRSQGPAAQTRTWIRSEDVIVEHHDTVGGVYRIRLPARSRSWESLGLAVSKETPIDALRTAIDGGTVKLLEHTETLYWNAARDGERAPGETDPAGFVRRLRALAVPSSLQSAVYGASTPGYASSQWSDGGHDVIDGDVWVPTPVLHYRPAAELHLPYRAVDPFGNATQVTYDTHGLFPVEVENALGHVTASVVDYHALAPREVIDPNQNHIELERDALGEVTKLARKGKDLGGGSWEGRTLAAPHEIYSYERSAWLDDGRPRNRCSRRLRTSLRWSPGYPSASMSPSPPRRARAH